MEGHFKSFRKENVHNYVCVRLYIYIYVEYNVFIVYYISLLI